MNNTRYRATFTTCLKDVASKFAERKTEYSGEFFCRHDPMTPNFALQFEYGSGRIGTGDKAGWLQAMVVIKTSVKPAIFITKQVLKLYDNDGKLLIEKEGGKRSTPLKKEGGWGFTEAYKPSDASKETMWRVYFEFEYEREASSSQYTPSNSCDLATDLLKLLETSTNADITFIVQGERINAHKAILATRCEYFQRMFAAKTKENATNEVEVPDFEPDVFRGMLSFLYSGLPPKNLADIALELLLASDKYGVEKLKKICEENAAIHSENVVDALLAADRIRNESLMTRAKAVFRSNVDELMQSDVAKDKLNSRPDLLLELVSHYIKE